MSPRIVFVTEYPDAADVAREMAPSGFDLVVAPARSAEYRQAMRDAEFLVGFVDMLVDEELYKTGPKLKLIQLLSAGYDRADLAAARKALDRIVALGAEGGLIAIDRLGRVGFSFNTRGMPYAYVVGEG